METKILEKIKRYFELSKQFTKSESELFDSKYISYNIRSGSFTSSAMGYIVSDSDGFIMDKKNLSDRTKSIENYRASENANYDYLIQKSKDYDEFIKLRDELTDYFKLIS